MTEIDLTPPAPPVNEKKGLFSGLFKKKDKPKEEISEKKTEINKEDSKQLTKEQENSKDSKAVNINLKELNDKPEKGKSNNDDLDEITSLIDQTINDIKKLQTQPDVKKVTEQENKAPEVPKAIVTKAVEVTKVIEPKKIEVAKPVVKVAEKPLDKPKVIVKPVIKTTAKPIIIEKKKIVEPAKVIKQPLKSNNKYSLPSDFDSIKKGISKESIITKNNTLEQELKKAKSDLASLPLTKATHAFHLENGIIIHDLKELVNAIEKADDKSFNHHVTDTKNDFATWIKTELKNPTVAKHVATFLLKTDVIRVLKEEAAKYDVVAKQELELKKKIQILEDKLAEQNKKNLLSKSPKDFFKLNNKTVKDIDELQKSISNITDKNYQEYVTANKEQMKKWLSYLSKDVIKEIALVNKKYDNLHEDIINQVNDYITKKVKDAETKAQVAKANMTRFETMAKQMQIKNDQLIKNVHDKTLEDKQLSTKIMTSKNELAKLTNNVTTLSKEKKLLVSQLAKLKKDLLSERTNNKKIMDSQIKETKVIIASLQKEITGMKTKLAKDRHTMEQEWNKLKDKEQKLSVKQKTLNDKETELNKRQLMLEEKETELKEVNNKFEQREKSLEKKKSELEVEGFQKYLQAKLKNVSVIDKETINNKPIENPFTQLIESCKDSIMQGDINTAKNKYLELKNQFESSNLIGEQKEIVYNSIRELYDDIMLNL